MTPILSLRVLGGLAIERDGAPIEAMATQRKCMAVLSLLAVAAPRGLSRDTVISYVWPESDAERARGALRQALHSMRPRVGGLEVVGRGPGLRLNSEVIGSDVGRFSDAIARADDSEAIKAYGGPFLDGFHLTGAGAFEQWVAEQRSRLARDFAGALERLANAATARGAYADAVGYWHRLAAADPLNGRIAVGLMRALVAAGDGGAALRHASTHETLLREELDCAPDPTVVAVAERVRSQSSAGRVERSIAPSSADADEATTAAETMSIATIQTSLEATKRRAPVVTQHAAKAAGWRFGVVVATGLFALFVVVAAWRASHRTPVPSPMLRLLIAPFQNLTGDAHLDHIGPMAADRLAIGVAQAGSMDVVPSMTVLMTMSDTTGGAENRLARLSNATHAGLLVSGAVLLRRDSLVLQAQVTDMRTGKRAATLDPVAGLASDPIAIIDALRDRLLGALGNRDRGLAIIPPSARAPKYAAYRELAAGFEHFAVQGDNMGSRPFFERAIAIDSDYVRAYQLLARQYLNAGEWARADSVSTRIERLPLGLSASERLQLDNMKAELRGDLAAQLRVQQQLVTTDSSALALELLGEAAISLLRPDLAIPALERSGPAYFVIGGMAARSHVLLVADAFHESGEYDRELRVLRDGESLFADASEFRARQLRALAGLARGAEALAIADAMLRGERDASGRTAMSVVTGAEEFRAHGDARTATRLVAMAVGWNAVNPSARASAADRQFQEGVALLTSGLSDSAIVRFTAVARDPARLDAAGYLALAHVARGDRVRAQAMADSLGALERPWLFGQQTFWRAAILGALGHRDVAVQLLRQSHREGQPMQRWHYTSALDSLRGYAPFDTLVRARPKNRG